MNGTVKFTGPDNITVTYTVDVYPAAADANLDGYPDVGAVPAVTIPGLDHGKRVPIR
jgi:expansin (peptidoglycan-binding protein)